MKEKSELSPTQQAFVQKKHATLAKLNNSFPRPSRNLYQGKPNIILGVAMGLDKLQLLLSMEPQVKQSHRDPLRGAHSESSYVPVC